MEIVKKSLQVNHRKTMRNIRRSHFVESKIFPQMMSKMDGNWYGVFIHDKLPTGKILELRMEVKMTKSTPKCLQ